MCLNQVSVLAYDFVSFAIQVVDTLVKLFKTTTITSAMFLFSTLEGRFYLYQ